MEDSSNHPTVPLLALCWGKRGRGTSPGTGYIHFQTSSYANRSQGPREAAVTTPRCCLPSRLLLFSSLPHGGTVLWASFSLTLAWGCIQL